MFFNRKFVKTRKKYLRKLRRQFISVFTKRKNWLLRAFLVSGRQPKKANAGFVLPTVAMVIVVVVLLTTAILFRSFERSKNASNVRINQIAMNAAAPALDRASAKLEQLLKDPSLPRSTPTDIAIYDVIKNNPKYNFGDETRLKLAFDINTNGAINPNPILEEDETLNTAWKFPVDTDNDGRFDTYTLYAISFRSPTRNNNNLFNRKRNPLDARTPPMDKSQVGGACSGAVGTSASLIGDSSWYKSGGTLAKSFFVYTVNVPIENITGLNDTKYEANPGNKGFSALEYQQDRQRIPVNNKAVWYENDLEITPGSSLLLNGAVHTNANLLAGGQYNGTAITFRQVSSKNSCYYEQENAKITIGGNIGSGNVSDTTNKQPLTIHLYQGFKVNPRTLDEPASSGVKVNIAGGTTLKSTSLSGGSMVGYNDAAYDRRINKMKSEALAICTSCDSQTTVAGLKTQVNAVARYPTVVKDNFNDRLRQNTGIDLEGASNIFAEELELYLRNRTRRVPFAEVGASIPTNTDALGSTYASPSSTVFTGSDEIEVPAIWRDIPTQLTLNLGQLPGTKPEKLKEDGKENLSGDRALTGNNLPAYWKNANEYVTGFKARQNVDSGTTKWDIPANTDQRTRASQIQPQLNLGVTDRNDFWEQKASEQSDNPLANIGGLRVITGAGIYVDDDGIPANGIPSYPRATNSFLPTPAIDSVFVTSPTAAPGAESGKMPFPPKFNDATPPDNIFVWSDTMPMTGGAQEIAGLNRKGDLLMRATAVYHFKDNAGTAQTPIACVSSYYDPTNTTTAINQSALPWNNTPAGGRSNNGIAYNFPGRTISAANLTILKRQSRLIFPNGRIANEPLRNAMEKYIGSSFTNFTLADYSAVDTALCAISILNGATPSTTNFAHGKIKEATFLDAREVKSLQDQTRYLTPGFQNTAQQGEYNLPLEQRQPLEIRVTDIDLEYLAKTAFATTEFLLPKSGIIYATRDDALPDLSYATIDQTVYSSNAKFDQVKQLSQTDFKLDPTRRPNGIRLIKGGNLARGGSNSATYDQFEKGLILVSNLPAYVKGEFNLHRTSPPSSPGTTVTQIEEFSDTTNGFYDQATFNPDFACRPGRTGCTTTTGDLWRPSTIISDAITLLSGTFLDGTRDQGDYDLRSNEVSIPGANLVNNFVTSSTWNINPATPTTPPTPTTTGYPANTFKTSYLANGVTPIQRRANFNEYLMEVCTKVPAYNCQPEDWYINPPIYSLNGTITNSADVLRVSGIIANETLDTTNRHRAGTTVEPANGNLKRYARRVAFRRDPNTYLLLNDANNLPVPIGISDTGTVKYFPYSTFNASPPMRPRLAVVNNSGLWFRTTTNSANPTNISQVDYGANNPLFIQVPSLVSGTDQPQLVPVLQIHSPEGAPAGGAVLAIGSNDPGIQNQWGQKVTQSTTFNTGFTAGNSPSRPEEESAGLPNFVRFLEFWGSGSSSYTAKIRGSFIQFKRSTFATAPFATLLSATITGGNTPSIFGYSTTGYVTNKGNPAGSLPYYTPPARDWGFDVALLSQLPDLFAQRFTVPPSGPPAEYFREVGRDDPWVKTLLCAAEGINKPVVSASYRPSDCPTVPWP